MHSRRQRAPAEETSVERGTPLPGSSAKVAHPPLPRLSSAARVSGIFDRLSTRLSVSALPPISRDKTLANMSTIMRQQLELAPRDSASARRSSTRTSASRMDEASAARACTAHTYTTLHMHALHTLSTQHIHALQTMHYTRTAGERSLQVRPRGGCKRP